MCAVRAAARFHVARPVPTWPVTRRARTPSTLVSLGTHRLRGECVCAHGVAWRVLLWSRVS